MIESRVSGEKRNLTVTAAAIEKVISIGIPGAAVRVEDVRGDGVYYAADICSGSFLGRTLLEQHRLVHEVLAGLVFDTSSQVLQITTRTQ